MPPKALPSTTWDPLLIVSQIISLQTVHYLTLCIIVPASLATFTDREGLDWEGGAASVGMIMDWRNIAGRPTSSNSWELGGWVWSAGRRVGVGGDDGAWNVDPIRGWVISACWLVACAVEYVVFAHFNILYSPVAALTGYTRSYDARGWSWTLP